MPLVEMAHGCILNLSDFDSVLFSVWGVGILVVSCFLSVVFFSSTHSCDACLGCLFKVLKIENQCLILSEYSCCLFVVGG